MEGIACLLGYMACGFFFSALYKLALDKDWLDKGEEDFECAIAICLFWPLVIIMLGIIAVVFLFLLPLLWLFSETES